MRMTRTDCDVGAERAPGANRIRMMNFFDTATHDQSALSAV